MDMEKDNKLVYQPPKLETVDMKLSVAGDIVPGVTEVLPPDADPDF